MDGTRLAQANVDQNGVHRGSARTIFGQRPSWECNDLRGHCVEHGPPTLICYTSDGKAKMYARALRIVPAERVAAEEDDETKQRDKYKNRPPEGQTKRGPDCGDVRPPRGDANLTRSERFGANLTLETT